MGQKSRVRWAKRTGTFIPKSKGVADYGDYSTAPGKRPSRAEMEDLVAAAYRTWDKMQQSNMCCVIFSEGYEKDPLALMQFATAIILDKPIALLAPKGRAIPGNVRALSSAIEVVDFEQEDDVSGGIKRLIKKVRGH